MTSHVAELSWPVMADKSARVAQYVIEQLESGEREYQRLQSLLAFHGGDAAAAAEQLFGGVPTTAQQTMCDDMCAALAALHELHVALVGGAALLDVDRRTILRRMVGD